MLKIRDLYVQWESVRILVGGVTMGTLVVEYEVREYTDLRNLARSHAYLVSCRQRLIVPNATGPSGPWGTSPFQLSPVPAFNDYPAVLANSMQLVPSTPAGVTYELLDYFPKTLNTAVVSSQNQTSGTNASYSAQHSSGSSISQTNSYDVSASAGFFGADLTGGVSVTQGHSTTTSSDSSQSTGSSTGQDNQSSNSDSMSIKDWGSYASVDLKNQTPSWLWGQEYPWNVLEFYDPPNLPAYVKQRLYDGVQVFPPSQLSLYGVNFLSRARWLVTVRAPSVDAEVISFTHTVKIFKASHGGTGTGKAAVVTASIDSKGGFSHTSPSLNLTHLGLDPIVKEGPGSGAVVGFSPQQFIAPPPSPPALNGRFRVKSTSNRLYVIGQGFDAPAGNDAPLTTSFPSGVPVEMTISFKITSMDDEYSLFLKHWRTAPEGCILTSVVNGQSPIIRHVDSLEAGSGSDNVSAITLRNKNYASVDFYDYLVLGQNTITIAIAPSLDNPSSDCGYAIRALAIG